MKVVDETESIREIENKIASGLVEELIWQAHNEIKLLRVMREWQPWREIRASEEGMKQAVHSMASFRTDNPFNTVWENYENMRHDKTPRGKY